MNLTAAQKTQNLHNNLLEEKARLSDHLAAVRASRKRIAAIQNTLTGVGIGVSLQREAEAEAAKPPEQPKG